MNNYIHVLIAMSILTSVMVTLPSYAATPDDIFDEARLARLSDVPIRVWTDKEVYDYGSEVHVEGVVANLKDMPVTATVTSPQGNVIGIEQVEVAEDKTFEIMFSAAGNLWKESGIYTIRVQYGSQEINDKVRIEILGAEATEVSCTADEITVRSETNAYCVPYNAIGVTVTDATISSSMFSIVLTVDAESDGSISLMIPRNILDSQSDEGDSDFIVLVDGEEADFTEVESDDTTRTLDITFPEGATEIEIIGTFAVPEFGTMAAIILAVAIVSIIAVSARSRLGILPRC